MKFMVLIAVGMLTTGAPPPEGDPGPTILTLRDAAMTVPFLDLSCGKCKSCGADKVEAENERPTNPEGLYHEQGCGLGEVCFIPCFDPTEEAAQAQPDDLASVWSTVVDGDAHTVRALLAEYGDRVELNADRQAIQMRGCGGRIVVNIPLTEEQAEGLGL